MTKRKATQQKTPLKQTKISSFFTKGADSNKRFCIGKENSPKKVDSPDIIICTPPDKTRARKSLLGNFETNRNAIANNASKSGDVSTKVSTLASSVGTSKLLSPENQNSPDVVMCTPPEKTSHKARKSLLGNLNNCGDQNKSKVKDLHTDKKTNAIATIELPKTTIDTVTPPKNTEGETVEVVCTPDVCDYDESPSTKKKKNLLDYFVKKEDVAKNLFGEGLRTVAANPDEIVCLEVNPNAKQDDEILWENDVVMSPKKSSDEIDSSTFGRSSLSLSDSGDVSQLSKAVNLMEVNSAGSSLSVSPGGGLRLRRDLFVADKNKPDVEIANSLTSSQADDFDSAFFDLPSSEQNKNKNDAAHFEDFKIEDFADGWSPQKASQNDLKFDPSVLCEVISADVSSSGMKFEQTLVVKAKDSGKRGRCVLRDMWAVNINFSIGDTLTIFATFRAGNWIVDAQSGYVCLFPEILVSSTSLVGAMFCRRRGVLSNYFKGLEAENTIMAIGSLVHEMLQRSLDIPSCAASDLEVIINDLIADVKVLRSLYSCGMTIEDVNRELRFYIPFIVNFLKVYVTGEEIPTGNNFKGAITKIVDIEENVSCLKLGIKGRIDVTVNVKINGKMKKMPLELKTGRASFSNEHRSQVFLYTLMMSSLGKKVESGLLLYLKEGILEEVKPSHVEIRDLILLRNDFAQYLRRFDVNTLPDPIRFVNACKKCPYSTICSAFLSDSVASNHPIRSLEISFDSDHLAYFQKWTQLLLLEDSYGSEDVDGFKLSGLALEKGFVRLKNQLKYTFTGNCSKTSLKVGNFVIVTSENLNYSGRIVNLTDTHCSVTLEKELPDTNEVFDIKGFKTTMLGKYLTNLGEVMEEPHQNLREIIINKQVAKINDKFPKSLLSKDCLNILGTLNEDQQRAILKVLAAEDYILIEGPPGTGKTQTIVALLRIFAALNNSVLLVGHTHSSVDNVLLRVPDIDYLRLGSLGSIHESIHDKSYAELCKNAKSVADIETLFQKNLIASTCLGLDADVVRKKKFDVCIVDESSQVLQPEVLKPLFCSKKFVLIGDTKQLRPVVRNPMAKQLGMDESIFERLFNDGNYVSLTIQYRMNKFIMGLANKLTYNNMLKTGSEAIENRVITLKSAVIKEKWMKTILSNILKDSIVFVDTGSYFTVDEGFCCSCENPIEAKLTVKIVETLINCGLKPDSIGVMSPFRAQIQKLNEFIPNGIEVNTVDQYQGRDKDVMIFSCCKMDRFATEKSENEILNDERRFNVSVTRAKCKLIFIGDMKTLVKYKTFARFFQCSNIASILHLEEGALGFSWAPFQA